MNIYIYLYITLAISRGVFAPKNIEGNIKTHLQAVDGVASISLTEGEINSPTPVPAPTPAVSTGKIVECFACPYCTIAYQVWKQDAKTCWAVHRDKFETFQFKCDHWNDWGGCVAYSELRKCWKKQNKKILTWLGDLDICNWGGYFYNIELIVYVKVAEEKEEGTKKCFCLKWNWNVKKCSSIIQHSPLQT